MTVGSHVNVCKFICCVRNKLARSLDVMDIGVHYSGDRK